MPRGASLTRAYLESRNCKRGVFASRKSHIHVLRATLSLHTIEPACSKQGDKELELKQRESLIKIGFGCTVVALVAGCASHKSENGTAKRGGGERQLNLVWAGKPYRDLLETYGEPTTVMEYPNNRMTTVVVYRDHVKLPASCSHAFTINHAGVPTVVNYFCR